MTVAVVPASPPPLGAGVRNWSLRRRRSDDTEGGGGDSDGWHLPATPALWAELWVERWLEPGGVIMADLLAMRRRLQCEVRLGGRFEREATKRR